MHTTCPPALPAGVRLIPLHSHPDERGVFTEIFRQHWPIDMTPLQWNAVRSASNVLRGFHGHWQHSDYLLALQGRMLVGLKDLRLNSPTYGSTALLELTAEQLSAVMIPPGVAHGFYFPEPALHVYAVSHYWDTGDELGCRWDDPNLGIPWPCDAPLISPRDAALPDLATLTRQLNQKLSETPA